MIRRLVVVAMIGLIGSGAPAAGQGGRAAQPRPGVGPADRPRVDPAAADRGRSLWTSSCATCHGPDARGTRAGPNLVRSLVVLRDRAGSELGPFLDKGHPAAPAVRVPAVTAAQLVDLTQFLRQRVDDTLKGSPLYSAKNVLTGDARAGAAYFNGDGGCTACHDAGGDLAGIASRVGDPVELQQRMVFPSGRGRGRGAAATRAAVTVEVTMTGGEVAKGVLVQMDDLDVSLRDASSAIRTIRRGPGVRVVKHDPLQMHHALLDRITDTTIHDLVAYLETLK